MLKRKLTLVSSHRYGLEGHEHLWTAKAFKKSCRGVSFTPDGSSKYSFACIEALVY